MKILWCPKCRQLVRATIYTWRLWDRKLDEAVCDACGFTLHRVLGVVGQDMKVRP